MGYAIVVDASVARSSGESLNFIARNCRDILDNILEYDHVLAMCNKLKSEWDDNASRYALTWLTDMQNKRRVLWVEVNEQNEVELQILAHVRIDDIHQIKKDMHLLLTAVMTDKRVISMDDRIRVHLGRIGNSVPVICTVMWLNPVCMPVSEWLRAGALENADYFLCRSNS